MIFYCISDLMLPTLIQRYDKNHLVLIQLKYERLTEILQAVRCHTFYDGINTIYQFIKQFLDKKCLILSNMEPFKFWELQNGTVHMHWVQIAAYLINLLEQNCSHNYSYSSATLDSILKKCFCCRIVQHTKNLYM